MANAWHHRSDALSSLGTAAGIGGAIMLGSRRASPDPIAAIIVSVLILRTAWKLMSEALGELLEKSLPTAMEKDIMNTVTEDARLSDIHHLRTRRIGSHIAREMHVCMPRDLSLVKAHEIVTVPRSVCESVSAGHVHQHTHGAGAGQEGTRKPIG